MSENYIRSAVGGSDIQVILEFPDIKIKGEPGLIHLASAISISYSVYRSKQNVYNIGQPLLAGLAIGKKYVAGSIITVSFAKDQISEFINKYMEDQEDIPKNSQLDIKDRSYEGYRDIHTVMRDDLTSFNMIFMMEDEYYGIGRQIKVYDAQFINNGQVMSINDIVTENTLSFIARDIREQHAYGAEIASLSVGSNRAFTTASSLLVK